jgi:hypothetical protein
MKTKTTAVRFHLSPVSLVVIKDNNNNKCGEDVAKQEPLYTAGGNGH